MIKVESLHIVVRLREVPLMRRVKAHIHRLKSTNNQICFRSCPNGKLKRMQILLFHSKRAPMNFLCLSLKHEALKYPVKKLMFTFGWFNWLNCRMDVDIIQGSSSPLIYAGGRIGCLIFPRLIFNKVRMRFFGLQKLETD